MIQNHLKSESFHWLSSSFETGLNWSGMMLQDTLRCKIQLERYKYGIIVPVSWQRTTSSVIFSVASQSSMNTTLLVRDLFFLPVLVHINWST